MTLRKKASENNLRKGENAGNQHFLLFPKCFFPLQNKLQLFDSLLFCRLQVLSIWTGLKFCCFNPLSPEQNTDQSKWKAFTDKNLNVAEMRKMVFEFC